jgi:hypothetical protein
MRLVYWLLLLTFSVGLLSGAILTGRVVLLISADISTIVIALAEAIVAVVLLMGLGMEGYSFFWIE